MIEVKGTSQDLSETLRSFNVAQERKENKARFDDFGGAVALIRALSVNIHTGLTNNQVQEKRELYGLNEFPVTKVDGLLEIFIGWVSHYIY